jgi:hypothetical protein
MAESSFYVCARCFSTIEKGRSDAEAVAEKQEHFPDVPLDDCDVICDDCFREVYPHLVVEDERFLTM